MATGFRKSPRLPEYDYVGPLAAHLIIVTRGRTPLFVQSELVNIALDALVASAHDFSTKFTAYCFMPDHLHLLVEVGEGKSLKDFVKAFKQRSSYALRKQTGDPAWQVSYYDRVLRRDEALYTVADYIWANPVEAGLVKMPSEYPFSGPRERLAQT